MPRQLASPPEVLIADTNRVRPDVLVDDKGLCRICSESVDARIVIRDGAVHFDKFCPRHGPQQALVASSAEWYLDCLSFVAPCRPRAPRARQYQPAGVPSIAAPAPRTSRSLPPRRAHHVRVHLDCPICYTVNRNDGAYQMSKEEFQSILDQLKRDHQELDIINITGGEPTLHPDLPGLLEMCRAPASNA